MNYKETEDDPIPILFTRMCKHFKHVRKYCFANNHAWEVWLSGHEKTNKYMSYMRSHVQITRKPNIQDLFAAGSFPGRLLQNTETNRDASKLTRTSAKSNVLIWWLLSTSCNITCLLLAWSHRGILYGVCVTRQEAQSIN